MSGGGSQAERRAAMRLGKVLRGKWRLDAVLGVGGIAAGHPSVVSVSDDDVSEEGEAFLVMDLLQGETLEARRSPSARRAALDLS